MEEKVYTTLNAWMNGGIDEADRLKIKQWLADGREEELTDAFYKDLAFGTGGLRGLMGLGSNRVNKYTIGIATQGLANYLNQQFENQTVSVAIAYDSRNHSEAFAQITANVFSANGIHVYLFEALRPTPELSFAIRRLRCQSGVVITASHNPKEYNGYKVYWADGAQVVPPHDERIIAKAHAAKDLSQVRFAPNPALIRKIGEEIDAQYLNAIARLSLSPEAIQNQSDLPIVFSAIHGTGSTLVPQALQKFGFTNVTVVEEQAAADGDFPTVIYPNPEEKEALTLAIEKAEAVGAALVLATDPDADRVGVVVKNRNGGFEILSGNQIGVLLCYYLCLKWKEKNKIDGSQYLVKTIVTTDLIRDLAQYFGVDCYDTLTGFKYIAQLIGTLEGKKTFIGGGEESYGYLVSDFVRDKDAVSSCAMMAELAAWAKDQDKTMIDLLEDLYSQFGRYAEAMVSLTKQGKKGEEEIQEMMRRYRDHPPKSIAGIDLVHMIDYQHGESKNLTTQHSHAIDFPPSNVLQFVLADGSKISMRPSGTEPKIKFYISVKTRSGAPAAQQQDELNTRIANIKQALDI